MRIATLSIDMTPLLISVDTDSQPGSIGVAGRAYDLFASRWLERIEPLLAGISCLDGKIKQPFLTMENGSIQIYASLSFPVDSNETVRPLVDAWEDLIPEYGVDPESTEKQVEAINRKEKLVLDRVNSLIEQEAASKGVLVRVMTEDLVVAG